MEDFIICNKGMWIVRQTVLNNQWTRMLRCGRVIGTYEGRLLTRTPK